MNRGAVQAALSTRWLGQTLHVHESLGSTSDEAARLARDGAPHGTVVIADAQHAGRGRRGRAWHSPPGQGVYLSAVLRLPLAAGDTPPVTLAAGVAVCATLQAWGIAGAGLKWPNDVLVEERKMGGILTETSVMGQRAEFVVLGVGLDVNAEEFPGDLDGVAISMRQVLGRSVDREALCGAVLGNLETWLDAFAAHGPGKIADAWRGYAVTLGRPVVIDGVAGVAEGIDPDGALLVATVHGVQRFHAGEVFHA